MAVFDDLSGFESMDVKALEGLCETARRTAPKSTQLRSALMVRGDTPKHLNKLDSMQADVAIINLEDGIAPEREVWARHLSGLFLSRLKESFSNIAVRVNPLDQGGDEEIAFFNAFKPDAIRIPKIRSPKEVEEALYLADTDIKIHLTIETREAYVAIQSLKLDPRVSVFYFGILDLLSDMNLSQSMVTLGNPTLDYMRARFITECALCGVSPMGFVYQDFQNLEIFSSWCESDRVMGFMGKGCISPKQVEIANGVFGIDPSTIKRAEHIVQRFEEESKKGNTGFSDPEYGFIDEPIYRDALLTLRQNG